MIVLQPPPPLKKKKKRPSGFENQAPYQPKNFRAELYSSINAMVVQVKWAYALQVGDKFDPGIAA